MRAVWLREFGGPEVLVPGAAPDPVPGEGQVLIDVAHANLTFVETQFRATGRGPFAGRLPMIPGNGVGGTVTALGPGADPGWLGRRVVSATGGSGGYAELAAVPAEGLHPVPDGLPLDAATALLADGRTARLLLETAAPAPGERVLVTAAAGGVGTLLVQLATAHAAPTSSPPCGGPASSPSPPNSAPPRPPTTCGPTGPTGSPPSTPSSTAWAARSAAPPSTCSATAGA